MNIRLGKWEACKELGRGGQGTVYLAEDNYFFYPILDSIGKSSALFSGSHKPETRLAAARALADSLRKYELAEQENGVAALKVLHEHLKKDGKAIARLTQEIYILTHNELPHIIKILDSSASNGWFAATFYPFGTLADNLDRFRSKPIEALQSFREIVDAVAWLHRNGMIHRDIKPANIFVSEQGLVLGDFGLAFFSDEAKTRISDTYENVGSRDWMPAWAYGKRVEDLTPSFDVFSLGKVLWAMISGKTLLPLWYHRREENDLARMFPEDPYVHYINALLDKCIKQNQEDEGFPTATELLSQIDRLLQIMKRGGELLRQNIIRTCRVCGYGKYQLRIDEKNRPGMSRDIGFHPVGHIQWRIFTCNRCGHAQMFEMSGNHEAWGIDTRSLE